MLCLGSLTDKTADSDSAVAGSIPARDARKKRTDNSVRFFQRYKFLTEFVIYLWYDISWRMRYVALRQREKEFISYRNEMKWSYIEFAKQIYRTSVSEYIAKTRCIYIVLLCQKKRHFSIRKMSFFQLNSLTRAKLSKLS